jgi:hypothetical protein
MMKTRIARGWQRGLVAGLLALPATTSVLAQEPPDTPKRTARDVEVYLGTRKVAPAVPVAIVPGRNWPAPAVTQVQPGDQHARAREPVAITVNAYALPAPATDVAPPNAPWLGAGASQVTPAAAFTPANPVYSTNAPHPTSNAPQGQPTVLVIREAAEGKPVASPAPEPARGVTLRLETLLGLGVGLLGLGVGLLALVRRSAPTPVMKYLPSSPAVAPDGGILLMGKYNAGPPREKAEKFEIGPSFQAEAQEKKKVAQQNEQAVLEFILSQNLALHAEMAGGADLPEAVEVAPEEVAGATILAAVH